MCHTLLLQNCIRINSQYSLHPAPISLWTWQTPNYHPSTFDTIYNTLTGYTTFPGFLQPTFRQWHWSPHNVDNNNSLIHGSHFKKEVISYQLVASKSLVIIPHFCISLHQCILFYYVSLILTPFPIYVMFYSFTITLVKLSSCLRDCNRHDNWLSCQNIIRILVNLIQSCPPDCTNFILFHDVKLLLLTYVLSQMLVYFFFFFFSSTNTTLLYLSKYTITHWIFYMC